MREVSLIKLVAFLNLMVALSIVLFWIGFFSELIVTWEVLAQKVKCFDAYYAWESSFALPDSVMACVMAIAAVRVLRDRGDHLGGLLLSACAGSMVFLGLLDFNYGINNGMYRLGHVYSFILLSIGLGLPVVGVSTIWVLAKERRDRSL